MAMNPLLTVLVWGCAFFGALAAKHYVRAFAGWNFFLLMLLLIVVESVLLVAMGLATRP